MGKDWPTSNPSTIDVRDREIFVDGVVNIVQRVLKIDSIQL